MVFNIIHTAGKKYPQRKKTKCSGSRNSKNLVHNSNLNDMNEHNRKDWFTEQYEKVIGKPLPQKELTTDEVYKRLKDSAKYRYISEAKTYKATDPQTGTVHYLEWSDPQITKCGCPDKDCSCRGGVLSSRKKIPRGERYFKSSLSRKLMQRFGKSAPTPTRNFMQRLAAVIGIEASVYKDLEKKGILSIRGAELCTSRCIRYYGAGFFPNSSCLLDKENAREKKMKMSLSAIDTDEENRLCDDYSCTVSTQSTVGPDGEFIIGNISHIIFATLDQTVMKDIEGTELHISSYKRIDNNSQFTTDNLFSLDKLLSWRDLINMQELKHHFSLFKRNIYSSIFEIKESNHQRGRGVPTTEYEKENVSKKSSEKISIATPYQGVIIKVKKEPQLSEIKKDGMKIEVEEQQKLPPMQNKKASDRVVTDLTIKHMQSPYNEIEGQIPAISTDKESDCDIIIKEDVENYKETHEKNNSNGTVSLKEDQMKLKEIKFLSSNPQISVSLSQHVVENIEDCDRDTTVTKQLLSKSGLFKDPKNLEGTRNGTMFMSNIKVATPQNENHTKCNIGHFFKKRLYKLSSEHLQKIKIKNVAESISYNYDDNNFRIKKDLKVNNNYQIIESDMIHDNNTNKSNEFYLDHLCLKESKPNRNQASSSLTNVSKVLSIDKPLYLQSLGCEMTSIRKDEVNCLSQPDETQFDSVSKNVISSDDKVPALCIHKTSADTYNKENPFQNRDVSKLTLLKDKNKHISRSDSVDLESSKKYKKSLQYGSHLNNKCLKEKPLVTENEISNEKSKQGPALPKKVSNISFCLKKLVWKNINNSIKSLPERTLYHFFRSPNNTKRYKSECDHEMYVKNVKKENNEEPKSSEEEVFSIQYNALLSEVQGNGL